MSSLADQAVTAVRSGASSVPQIADGWGWHVATVGLSEAREAGRVRYRSDGMLAPADDDRS